MTAHKSSQSPDHEQPLVAHLLELRDRLLRAVLAVLVVFLVLFPFANDLYVLVSEPLRETLPAGSSMISTKPIDPFLIPFKLSLQLAIFIAVPFILYQFWAFVAPGLYKHEKRLVMPLLISSTLLFYLGMAFAYFVVFPLVFPFSPVPPRKASRYPPIWAAISISS
jgi:sec-independent protein translocase protein TatC